MDGLSKVVEKVRLPVNIPVYPYLLDHCVEGHAVVPAVEAMEWLTATVLEATSDIHVGSILDGRFEKFLYIRPGQEAIEAVSDIAFCENGDITATLLTKTTSKKASITRVKEHATIRFSPQKRNVQELPLDLAAVLEGKVFSVSADRIYHDLVPFGPSYRNLIDPVVISEDGVIAHLMAPEKGMAAGNVRHLGSPFPMDASFHAACVWGQRFAGFVAFPVGFGKRIILNPTRSGENYIARVVPVRTGLDELVFDIWIFDGEGCLFEAILGVVMKDISAGRMKPPPWIFPEEKDKQLQTMLRGRPLLSLIEIGAMAPFAEKALSEMELKRFERMGDKRKSHYLSARLACKRLARRLWESDMHTPAPEINTIYNDLVRPRCPSVSGADDLFCAASHDNRFAVAVASEHKIGVDIERASSRVLKCQDLFMHERETVLIEGSALDMMDSTLRIWSVKEAACKALNTNLADCWKRVEVTVMGYDESRFSVDQAGRFTAFHHMIEQHLITILEIP